MVTPTLEIRKPRIEICVKRIRLQFFLVFKCLALILIVCAFRCLAFFVAISYILKLTECTSLWECRLLTAKVNMIS